MSSLLCPCTSTQEIESQIQPQSFGKPFMLLKGNLTHVELLSFPSIEDPQPITLFSFGRHDPELTLVIRVGDGDGHIASQWSIVWKLSSLLSTDKSDRRVYFTKVSEGTENAYLQKALSRLVWRNLGLGLNVYDSRGICLS